MPKKLL